MKALFELTHPKHFYQFRHIINVFVEQGHEVKIIARDKDVLLQVLEDEGYAYEIYGKHKKKMTGKVFNIFNIFFRYLRIAKNFNPDYILSKASFYAVMLKPFVRAKLVITPDSEVVWLTRKIVAPCSHIVITPQTYTLDYGIKQKRINGFFEECYLGPENFIPDRNLLKTAGLDPDNAIFILRFISWSANHDVGQFGFSEEEKIRLVKMLRDHGEVIISAEGSNVPEELQQYLNPLPPSKIHHLLYHANMYIGDSQSMATESALLGTPSLRYNSFVGPDDMSNFIILEKEGLMKNFSAFNDLKNEVENMLANKNLKREWQAKRQEYFSSKHDVNVEIVKFITNE